jgi:hypothetical protein
MKQIPAWATAYIAEWKQTLYLHEWTITTELSPHPNDDSNGTKACVTVTPDILFARMEIKDSIPDDLQECGEVEAEGWKKTLIHELLHVKMGRVTEFVNQELIPELAGSAQGMAIKAFRREVEPFVEIMSEVMYRLARRDDS